MGGDGTAQISPAWAEVAVRLCHIPFLPGDLVAHGLAHPCGSSSRSECSFWWSHLDHPAPHPCGQVDRVSVGDLAHPQGTEGAEKLQKQGP